MKCSFSRWCFGLVLCQSITGQPWKHQLCLRLSGYYKATTERTNQGRNKTETKGIWSGFKCTHQQFTFEKWHNIIYRFWKSNWGLDKNSLPCLFLKWKTLIRTVTTFISFNSLFLMLNTELRSKRLTNVCWMTELISLI